MQCRSESHEHTQRIGSILGQLAFPGLVIALNGDLGAGKTVFAKGVGEGLHVTEVITSPTFVLMQLYESGRIPLVHADLYRLSGMDEALELGMDELMGVSVVVLEWPERIPELLPADHLWVDIDIRESTRVFRFQGSGSRVKALLIGLSAALDIDAFT